jgi:hypothetical protein
VPPFVVEEVDRAMTTTEEFFLAWAIIGIIPVVLLMLRRR